MTPTPLTLAVVTATTDLERAAPCLRTWQLPKEIASVVVLNGPKQAARPQWREDGQQVFVHSEEYLGTVAAFRKGVETALRMTHADIIACFHDDLEILVPEWWKVVTRHFQETRLCGLAGFGGAVGLGDDDIYKKPYAPVQLARRGFRSNLVDAEVHGVRSALRQEVVCLDGFSQIGRREFWEGRDGTRAVYNLSPWLLLKQLGVVHHAYDGMLGCIAARYHWQVWYLPVRCRHLGGQTAVGDQGYQEWAKAQQEGGDHGFWEQAHRIWYDEFKDTLPLRV